MNYGKIAYEAAQMVSGCTVPWEEANQAEWEAAAGAARQGLTPMDFQLCYLAAMLNAIGPVEVSEDLANAVASCDALDAGRELLRAVNDHITKYNDAIDRVRNGLTERLEECKDTPEGRAFLSDYMLAIDKLAEVLPCSKP